jgi:hypothetical protein
MVNNKRSNLLKVWGYILYVAAGIVLAACIYYLIDDPIDNPALALLCIGISAIFVARLVFSGAVLVRDAEYRLHDRGDEAFTKAQKSPASE